MKKIFISRKISEDSPIHAVSKDHLITDKSLIEFAPLKFEAPRADWIFFYSRNGVKYFFEGGNYALHPYLWACMSDGTADELSHYVHDIGFVGTGNPKEVASSFQKAVDDNQVTCFIRAENSKDSVCTILNKPNDFSIPVYKNEPTTNIPNGEFDILIFTSPLNVETWFNANAFKGESIIAIGETTANSLRALEIKNINIAKTPSEVSLAHELESLL